MAFQLCAVEQAFMTSMKRGRACQDRFEIAVLARYPRSRVSVGKQCLYHKAPAWLNAGAFDTAEDRSSDQSDRQRNLTRHILAPPLCLEPRRVGDGAHQFICKHQ